MSLFDPKMVKVTLKVESDVRDDFESLCVARGLEPEQMFRVMLRSFTRRKVVFHLTDELNFGKYNGLVLEEVIRADPRYMNWLVNESQWFRLSDDAERLLYALGEED
jgi:hypothetical protein